MKENYKFSDNQRFPKGFITPEKTQAQAKVLSNSLQKKYRHLAKRFKRQNIDCFRLYDWDSPDIRLVVDWYAGHVVVAEYERLQTTEEYLPFMAQAAGDALGVLKDKIHIKLRRTNIKVGPRYQKLASEKNFFQVSERELCFLVNLTDHLDTGLYSDHRNTRVIIQELVKGKDFINLFAYTGAFTCAAAKAGAKSTTTVDRSKEYIDWAQDNLKLNKLIGHEHEFIQSDVIGYLAKAVQESKSFDLVFLDPPSFYKDEQLGVSFDIDRDHPDLIAKTLKVLRPRGDLFFSTNHQRFEPRFEGMEAKEIIELTPKTIPEDYRNRVVHRCWRIKR